MDRRTFLKSAGAVTVGAGLAPLGHAIDLFDLPTNGDGRSVATGVVFHDRNGSGRREPGDPGIGRVCVSNGSDVVMTDSQGRYTIEVLDGNVLFVIKPSGWKVPVNGNNLPQFFYVHAPQGSGTLRYPGMPATGSLPRSLDFALQPQKEDKKFSMILFGDPQPRNQTEIDYIAHDVIEQVTQDISMNNAKFGLSLGDQMFDDLSLYGSLNGVVGSCGIPWYNTVGNHDLNYDSVDSRGSTETWKRIYGPPHYAFNYGPVHFLVLKNVMWHGKATPGYHGEFSQRQLDFVRNVLATVSKDRLVVIAMHIPLVDTRNKEALLSLLAGRKYTFSLSAHTHVQEHHFLGAQDGWTGEKPHHHLNHVTVCGSWWQGALDERGIPNATMADGAPNGYSLVQFNGNKYTVTFRGASRPRVEQMGIWLPEAIPIDKVAGAPIIVNVFAGSSRSTVEMSIDGDSWTFLTQFEGMDPYFLKLKEIEAGPKPPTGLKLPGAAKTSHLWKGKLPNGLGRGIYSVRIRTTDMFGQTYTARRVLRVTPPA